MCVCVFVCGEVYICTVCSISTSHLACSTDSPQSDDVILSEKVYGKLVILVSL